MPKIIENSIWPLSERTAALQCFDHLKTTDQLVVHPTCFPKTALLQNAFSMQKNNFLKSLREAAFCEGSREAPGRLCKKLLPRSFLPHGSFAIFLCAFFFVFYHILGPGFEIIAPRALKTCVARTTIGPENNYTFKYAHGVLGHRMPAEETAAWPRRFWSPRRHIVSPTFGCGIFSHACTIRFLHLWSMFFSIWVWPTFSPRGDQCFCSFCSANFSSNFLFVRFLYMFSMFFIAFLGNESAGSPGSLFFAWWRSNFGIGVTHFLKIPSCTFWLFWRPKTVRILLRFFDNIWAPRGPLVGCTHAQKHRRW